MQASGELVAVVADDHRLVLRDQPAEPDRRRHLAVGERTHRGHRSEDLERLTFLDGSFDVVITSEVFEHVGDPWAGLSEVRRILRIGGRHVWTVPMLPGTSTASRRNQVPVYHTDPLRPQGIAVVTDFGDDGPELLRPLGFETDVHLMPDHDPVVRVFESRAV